MTIHERKSSLLPGSLRSVSHSSTKRAPLLRYGLVALVAALALLLEPVGVRETSSPLIFVAIMVGDWCGCPG